MTVTEARTQIRRYARVSTTAATNGQLDFLIGQAFEEFAVDVGGFPTAANLAIAAKFDTETNYAVRVTVVGGTGEMSATDVLITGTARSGTTGTIVASDFETTLQAATGTSMTVTWANFEFTIDTLDATSITFAAPSTVTYVDARDLLGLPASPTLSDFSFTGNFPEDCTMEATIPTDAVNVERVEWDDNPVYPLTRVISPELTGTPQFYNLRGREIRLYPTPTSQKRFHIEYRGVPTGEVFQGYQECGLSSLTGASATGLSATTQYYYKITIDGEAQTEYDITTASNLDYNNVITLLNAENSGATFAIVDGDLRCTSDTVTEGSAIALAAGTTGTDLFATLTGWSAFDTAVARSRDMPDEIPEQYHKYVVYLTTAKLLFETHEMKEAQVFYGMYLRGRNKYMTAYHGKHTAVSIGTPVSRLPKVSM